MRKFKLNDSSTTYVKYWPHGKGKIIEISDDKITVDFGSHLCRSSKKKDILSW